jgi:hypothetical protein
LESSLTALQKVKHRVIIWPSIPLLRIYPRGKNTGSHKNWYTNIHSSIIHNSQNQKQSNQKCPLMNEYSLVSINMVYP